MGQYSADYVASYVSQHKKGLSVDRSLRKAGPPLVFCFLHRYSVGIFSSTLVTYAGSNHTVSCGIEPTVA